MHCNTSADAVVVGAGPAGAATALLLARAGFDVRLLDRSAFPRDKPCGDCLSAGTDVVLRRLGVADAVHALPAARLVGWRITAPDGSAFTARFGTTADGAPLDAVAVERRLLDDAILRAAIDAGVTFVPGTRVTDLIADRGRVTGVRGHDFTCRARLTIGADGLRSVVATRLGAVRRPARLRKVSLTMHVETSAIDDDFGEMHVADGMCVGLAPVSVDRRRCNLTVVADAGRYGRELARDRAAFVAGAIAAMPGLRRRIDVGAVAADDMLASGPFDRPVREFVFDGAALVGDAAGYYDPFTGQGVYQALASAEALAPIATAALENGDVSAGALLPYQSLYTRRMRGPRAVQRVIETVLSRPALANYAIRRVAAADAFARALIGVTGDVAPVSRLFTPGVLYSLMSRNPETAR